MRNLKALTSFSYGTRRLQADDYFTAGSIGDARALVTLKKAAYADAQATKTTPHPLDHDGNGRKGGAKKPAAQTSRPRGKSARQQRKPASKG